MTMAQRVFISYSTKDYQKVRRIRDYLESVGIPCWMADEGIRSGEQFVALTKELTDTLRKNRTIDWNKRESARAQMRTMVKRLLRKYNYPPEGQEQALEVVMEQCNQWADQEYYDAIAESGGRPIF